jgi:transcriptional regulator with XRE-family HTH domain
MITKLKIERLRRGIRQWDLANRSGIDNTKLSLIETGQLMPSKEIKRAISKVLRIPVRVLFPGGDKNEQEAG